MEVKKWERQEVISYTRVVGWLTPTKNFNKGKVSELKDRLFYKLK